MASPEILNDWEKGFEMILIPDQYPVECPNLQLPKNMLRDSFEPLSSYLGNGGINWHLFYDHSWRKLDKKMYGKLRGKNGWQMLATFLCFSPWKACYGASCLKDQHRRWLRVLWRAGDFTLPYCKQCDNC